MHSERPNGKDIATPSSKASEQQHTTLDPEKRSRDEAQFEQEDKKAAMMNTIALSWKLIIIMGWRVSTSNYRQKIFATPPNEAKALIVPRFYKNKAQLLKDGFVDALLVLKPDHVEIGSPDLPPVSQQRTAVSKRETLSRIELLLVFSLDPRKGFEMAKVEHNKQDLIEVHITWPSETAPQHDKPTLLHGEDLQSSYNEEKDKLLHTRPSSAKMSPLETRYEGDLIDLSRLSFHGAKAEVFVSRNEEELRTAIANRLKVRTVLRLIRSDYNSMFF